MNIDTIRDSRSSVSNENIQELIDAAVSPEHALQVNAQQYSTPPWLGRACCALLYEHVSPVTTLDPQCAGGNLLAGMPFGDLYGIDLDKRHTNTNLGSHRWLNRLTCSCVKAIDVLHDLLPEARFTCWVANPPFGIRWKVGEGKTIDSTLWTWETGLKMTVRNGAGFLISSKSTLERFGIASHPHVYLYQTFPAGIWENTVVEIGIVHWRKTHTSGPRHAQHWTHIPTEDEIYKTLHHVAPSDTSKYFDSGAYFAHKWKDVEKIVVEESRDRPDFNVYLNKEGDLRTYLSTRAKCKIEQEHIQRLARIDGKHPLTLTPDRETRKLLQWFITSGVYTIQPEAKAAIEEALAQVAAFATPLRPPTDFELVAYADEEDHLISTGRGMRVTGPNGEEQFVSLTPGKKYEIGTGTYRFVERFNRKKLHVEEDEDTGKEITYVREHECSLSGTDRYIQFTDDRGERWRFLDRPQTSGDLPEPLLWEMFQRPVVKTIADLYPEKMERARSILELQELLAGFTYFDGQRDYIARMSIKDYGLVGADVGCHAAGQLIMMADGRSKKVEDVVPGESLMGWDGTPRRVLRLSRGFGEMVRIVPTKGEPFVVNKDHILTLVQTNVHHSRPLAKTNGAIRDVTVREYLTWPKEWRDNHKLFRKPLGKLPVRKLGTFSPYFMGVYLGDGNSTHGLPSITKPDREIRTAVEAECAMHGWKMSSRESSAGCPVHFIKGPQVKLWLAGLGLLGRKSGARFIPEVYKLDSYSNRLELLAGLLDTDGHLDVRCGVFDYVSQSRRLADDVAWVARSVGLAAYVSSCEKGCQTGAIGTYYRVCISGHVSDIPTRIPRKQAKPRQQKKDVLRTGFSVEPAGNDYFYGFTIEGDGRFLLGDFTVTHNTGKSLMALTLIALKGPRRTLLIAPQGTMRSTGDDEEAEDYHASQWVSEIQRFAPTEPVFQLFSPGDYYRILAANKGTLPDGIYISYPQAMFYNGAREWLPASWYKASDEYHVEQRTRELLGLPFDKDTPPIAEEFVSAGVGDCNEHGIKCIITPSLATLIGDVWDMVILDEAHLICNLAANVTQSFIRLQPKYRYALTATPIPNIVSNLFSIMGWLCVQDWYKGKRLNAAWPYAVEDEGTFSMTFLAQERDHTAENEAKRRGKKLISQRPSPIISSPARLLKLLKPTMAYISKEECNSNLVPCEVVDVRVPAGLEQGGLYAYYMDRANIPYDNPLTKALVQMTWLRGICADPATCDYNKEPAPVCMSNFNPKTIMILQLVHQCLARGEQVVVVAARKGQSTAVAARLMEAGIPISRIDSTIDASEHAAQAAAFKEGRTRVMLMGIKCAQGHSFDQCPNLIIGSLEWSYGSLHQAKGRVWRLTSPKPVKVWCVLHAGTIEELLFDRVALKQDAATICLRGMRVPRDFKTVDPSELLAEHWEDFDSHKADVEAESVCEDQWPALRSKLAIA